MERGSDKHGPRMDDDLEREAKAAARRNPPVRGEDWPDPEDPNQPEVTTRPSTPEPNTPTPADLDPRRR